MEESSRASESKSEDESESAIEEEDEVEDDHAGGDRSPVGVAVAPKDKRTLAWVKKAKKHAEADKDKKPVKDDLSQTTAAALRQQGHSVTNQGTLHHHVTKII